MPAEESSSGPVRPTRCSTLAASATAGPATSFHEVNEGSMVQLGRSLARWLRVLVDVVEAGVESGEFSVARPDLLANVLYTQALGGLQLARLRLLVREANPDVPDVVPVSADEVKHYLIEAGVAIARG